MSVYLCGNSGIVNRGCEAIIRSTNKLLSKKYNSLYLATHAPSQDNLMCKSLGINLLQYCKPNIVQRVIAKGFKILGNYTYIERIQQESIISKLSDSDYCLNIGGDTYCYGKPFAFMALNKLAKSKGAKSVLWCCSIEEDVISGEIKRDLNRYDYIFARESITVNNLLKKGIKADKVVKVCDPAFFLDAKETILPPVFNKGKVVGINVSECVIRGNDKTVYNAVLEFLKSLLHNTNLNICLIPHVYSIDKNICDWPILFSLKQDLNSERVDLVDKELSCEELKYIISKCEFVVASRTHASIAAYSSGVPTLVIGYSVKSKGIATDLFGTSENYVIPYNDIQTKEDLIKPFEYIVNNKINIIQRLNAFLPEYKETLLNAIEKYIHQDIDYSKICDSHLCSGCTACKYICPQNAIDICIDHNGFVYPEIDQNKCIKCNKCRNICPSLNKINDTLTEPRCFGYINPDDFERDNSSSGGAFIQIASRTIENGGVVYGVEFDDNCIARFTRATKKDELKKIQKSKYVQAIVGDIYSQVKNDLETGVDVLFSGCPCHVVSLKRFLCETYDNLTTVDVVCHGVPSPKAWQEYKNHIEDEHKSKITDVSFRNKERGWKNISISFSMLNGEKVSNLLSNDIYFQGFISHFYNRHSCYNCSTRNMHRVSDITLADFWGIEKIDPTMFDDKGTSLLLVHSKRGIELVEFLKKHSKCKEYSFSDSIADNPAYLLSSTPNIFVHQFDKAWNKKGLIFALNEFLGFKNHKMSYFLRSIKPWSK